MNLLQKILTQIILVEDLEDMATTPASVPSSAEVGDQDMEPGELDYPAPVLCQGMDPTFHRRHKNLLDNLV